MVMHADPAFLAGQDRLRRYSGWWGAHCPRKSAPWPRRLETVGCEVATPASHRCEDRLRCHLFRSRGAPLRSQDHARCGRFARRLDGAPCGKIHALGSWVGNAGRWPCEVGSQPHVLPKVMATGEWWLVATPEAQEFRRLAAGKRAAWRRESRLCLGRMQPLAEPACLCSNRLPLPKGVRVKPHVMQPIRTAFSLDAPAAAVGGIVHWCVCVCAVEGAR